MEKELQRSLSSSRGAAGPAHGVAHTSSSPHHVTPEQGGCFRGGVCCGKTPAPHAMEYEMMPRNASSGGVEVWQLSLGARSSSESPIPVGLSQLWLCGSSCQSGSACPMCPLKAELPCVSAATASSSSPQPRDGCSVRGTPPLLMRVHY